MPNRCQTIIGTSDGLVYWCTYANGLDLIPCKTIVYANINSMRLCDTIWQHKSGSTLAQVMACCMTALSHYLSQCWILISVDLWHSPENKFAVNALVDSQCNEFENCTQNFYYISQGPMSWYIMVKTVKGSIDLEKMHVFWLQKRSCTFNRQFQ